MISTLDLLSTVHMKEATSMSVIMLSSLQTPFTGGPPCQPIFRTAYGAHGLLSTICSVVLQSLAGFLQTLELHRQVWGGCCPHCSGLGSHPQLRPRPGVLPELGPRVNTTTRLPGLRSCSWRPALTWPHSRERTAVL